MSGVWVFEKNGVARLISKPATAPGSRPKVLVYLPTNHVIGSFDELEQYLVQLGWSRYQHSPHPHVVQFHRSHASPHLISLPSNFCNFKHFHFYHIVLHNPCFFQVRDPTLSH